MKVVIVGCGRVGSGVAKQLAEQGWDVTCVDEDERALTRLGEWRGGSVVGHGKDVKVPGRAGRRHAEAAVKPPDGDNPSVGIGQVVQKRYAPATVVVRVLGPRRAAVYAERGLPTVCPTQTEIATLIDVVRSTEEVSVV